MLDLAKRTNEIIHLSILDQGEIVYLDKKGEGQTLTVATKIGGRSPAHACGMGKVLLSGLPPEELSKFLASAPFAKLTPKTISEAPKLLRELARIRKSGFAVDDEESFLGIRCVAAPIHGSQGRIEAALSITAPKQRMGQERLEELKKEVIETARAISKSVAIGMSGGI
jgi:DNA-binding IclR family transcriptional regulator